MPEPLTRFNHGDPASKALNASFLNSIIDRLNRLDKSNRHKPSINTDNATLYCDAVNNTSLDFPEFSILTPYRPGVTIATADELSNFQADPLLDVITPTATAEFPVIAVEPIRKNGGIGRVAIGGVAVCTVNITNTGHEYATTTASDNTRMTSAATGTARIIWKASAGTGNKTSLVVLPFSPPPPPPPPPPPSTGLYVSHLSSTSAVGYGPTVNSGQRITGTCTGSILFSTYYGSLGFESSGGYIGCKYFGLTPATGFPLGPDVLNPLYVMGTRTQFYRESTSYMYTFRYIASSTVGFDLTNNTAGAIQILFYAVIDDSLSTAGMVASLDRAFVAYTLS